jgi:hypothetical protein
LTWSQALRWRLRRQCIDPSGDLDAVGVATRLCGVQAQMPSAAELGIAVRTAAGTAHQTAADVSAALAAGRLVRTWSVRGTLHLLPLSVASRQLSLLAAARSWHKGSWQRAFLPLGVMTALAEHVGQALEGDPLTREELVATVAEQIDDDELAEHLRSGWSSVLKPLAWQGILCQGPARGRSVTFTRPDRVLPDWPGLADPDQAGPSVVRDYLAAFGPATIEAFDAWLLRGATPKAQLRAWFASLDDELVQVDVGGRPAFALCTDLEELTATRRTPDEVHLLPGFDQYVLGPGTNDDAVVPAEHRALVSRAGGWISPVVLVAGRVAGTWENVDGVPRISLFPGIEPPRRKMAAAIDRMTALLSSEAPTL